VSQLITPKEPVNETTLRFTQYCTHIQQWQIVEQKPVKQPTRAVWVLALLVATVTCAMAMHLDNVAGV
jgi:hypothetical protein